MPFFIDIPPVFSKLVDKDPKILNFKNKRKFKTDICLADKDLEKVEITPNSPYLTPFNIDNPIYMNYSNANHLQQHNEDKCLNSSERLDVNRNQLNNVKIESLNETSSILIGNIGTNESSLLLQDSKKNSFDKNSSIGSVSSVEKSAKNPKSQVCHWRDVKLAKIGRKPMYS